jgi:hypothetical protein
VLDAKVLHMDMVTVLAVARQYGGERLHEMMKAAGMSTSPDESAGERLRASELGLILAGESLGIRKRGKKPGPGTQQAFGALAQIAGDGLVRQRMASPTGWSARPAACSTYPTPREVAAG